MFENSYYSTLFRYIGGEDLELKEYALDKVKQDISGYRLCAWNEKESVFVRDFCYRMADFLQNELNKNKE